MYKLLLTFCALVIVIGGLISCKKDADLNPETAGILEANKQDILTYAASKGLSGTMTTSGLYYVVNQPSSSTVVPAYKQELEFTYKLYRLNGPSNTTVTSGVTDTLVDSTYATTSVFYPFFENSLRPGLQEAFLLMNEGERVTLLIPSELAFGNVVSPDGNVPANSPVRYDITLKRARTEDQQIAEYIAANKLTVTETTSTGLRFIRTKTDATAKVPTAAQTLTIKSSGKLFRYATAFDSTGTSYSTSLGKSAMAGFNEGLAKLRIGEKATLIFPSSLGYDKYGTVNSNGVFVVPPYTPLRYDIELISAQ